MNRYVAFLDILGFGDMVREEKLDAVKARLAEALSALDKSREVAPMIGFQSIGVRPVHVFSFSDTFVLLSDNESTEALLSFLSATIYLTRTLYAQALPVRGAVTFGEADFIDKTQHAVGKAIVAAAELEKRQNWFGVMVDDGTFPDDGRALIAQKEFSKVLLRWDIPFKSEALVENSIVINWRYNLAMNGGDVGSLCRPSKRNDVQQKLLNTAAFEDYLKVQNLHEGPSAVHDQDGHDIFTPWLTRINALAK